MKDYYGVLDVPEGSSQDDIKKAFRKLAVRHHPDKNPGNESQAEAKFKEINEAYSILGDATRRQQYDQYRRSPFAPAGAGGPVSYDQEQVFRSSFSDPAFFTDLDRMFRDAGLRFDPQFVNSMFGGGGKGFAFHVYAWPSGGAPSRPSSGQAAPSAGAPWRKLTRTERFVNWCMRFILKRTLGVEAPAQRGRDLRAKAIISSAEAELGGEKEISYKRGAVVKRLIVKIPAGTRDGTCIRLKGMGTEGQAPGDLYLMVKVKRS